MRVALRPAIAGLGCALALLAVAGNASADPAAFDDPRDTSGALDIARVGHTNDDETATYRVEFHEPFTIDDVDELVWEFDFDGDGRAADACALLRKIGTTGVLRATFARDCGPEAWATADARIDARALEFSLPLIDLVEGGGLRPGLDYSYKVVARDVRGVEDTAPQEALAVHEDVPAPTPRPGSAETELGYQGQGASEGAGNAARPAGAADTGPVPGEGEGPAPTSGGVLDVSFRFGPVPVCSGVSCFALGVGAPVAAYALVRLVARRRARRRRATNTAADRTIVDHAPRSSPGHSSFV